MAVGRLWAKGVQQVNIISWFLGMERPGLLAAPAPPPLRFDPSAPHTQGLVGHEVRKQRTKLHCPQTSSLFNHCCVFELGCSDAMELAHSGTVLIT